MNPTKITTRRLAVAAVRYSLAKVGRGHDDPHFECLTETRDQDCDGLLDPDVCVCPSCDARACGLHVTTRHALMEENAQ